MSRLVLLSIWPFPRIMKGKVNVPLPKCVQLKLMCWGDNFSEINNEYPPKKFQEHSREYLKQCLKDTF